MKRLIIAITIVAIAVVFWVMTSTDEAANENANTNTVTPTFSTGITGMAIAVDDIEPVIEYPFIKGVVMVFLRDDFLTILDEHDSSDLVDYPDHIILSLSKDSLSRFATEETEITDTGAYAIELAAGQFVLCNANVTKTIDDPLAYPRDIYGCAFVSLLDGQVQTVTISWDGS